MLLIKYYSGDQTKKERERERWAGNVADMRENEVRVHTGMYVLVLIGIISASGWLFKKKSSNWLLPDLSLFRRAHSLLHPDCQEMLTAVNVGFVVDRVTV